MTVMTLTIPPLRRAAGTIKLPGSKSISNRVLLLAALAEGHCEIADLLESDDTRVMLDALQALGVSVRQLAGDHVQITGCGGRFPVRHADIFVGNAGTAVRPLTAALALAGGSYTLHGVARMHERPIGDLVDGLRQVGADITYIGNDGFPPLRIGAGEIAIPSLIRMRGDVSSQFLTAMLMALPLAGQPTTIELTTDLISKPYIEITLSLMERFGVVVRREGWSRFDIDGCSRYRSPARLVVEGDASSASYFLAAGAIGGGPVRVSGAGRESIQGDIRFGEALACLGVHVTAGDHWVESSALPGGHLRGFDLDANHIPDAAMTLAVLALFADGPCRLTNIASWRVKETDRIEAMATELRKLGATVLTGPDHIRIFPPAAINPGIAIDTYDDHRMAMSFSLVAFAGVPVVINDPGCVAKTFPRYFDALAGLCAPVIAVDGPSASGKGTVAARVADRLGYHYLDSGALYRLVALAAIRQGRDLTDEPAIAAIAAELPAQFGDGRTWLGDDDVTDAIRAEAVSASASKVAALPTVRGALLDRQRAYRRFPGLVADGRDMGTMVFPDAQAKVYLTASARTRAERRHKQLIEKGVPANMHALLQDLQERDARDAQRAAAPLRQAPDAVAIDTTSMDIDAVVAAVLEAARKSGIGDESSSAWAAPQD